MKKFIPLILITALLLTGCDAGSSSTQQGKIIKITEFPLPLTESLPLFKMEVRIDCKNQNCKTESFYFTPSTIGSNWKPYYFMEQNQMVSFKYKDYVVFNKLIHLDTISY